VQIHSILDPFLQGDELMVRDNGELLFSVRCQKFRMQFNRSHTSLICLAAIENSLNQNHITLNVEEYTKVTDAKPILRRMVR
jgi:hypothetical protein